MKQNVLEKLQMFSRLRHKPKSKPMIDKPKPLTFEEKQAKAKALVKLYNL